MSSSKAARWRIDKSMVDVLIDPLMHMVRNAVDHGIETPIGADGGGQAAARHAVDRCIGKRQSHRCRDRR